MEGEGYYRNRQNSKYVNWILFTICRHGGEVTTPMLTKIYEERFGRSRVLLYRNIKRLGSKGYIQIYKIRRSEKRRGKKEATVCRLTNEGIASLRREIIKNSENRRQICEALFNMYKELFDHLQFRLFVEKNTLMTMESFRNLMDGLLEAVCSIDKLPISVNIPCQFRSFKDDETFNQYFNGYVTNYFLEILRAIPKNKYLCESVLEKCDKIFESRNLSFSKNELRVILDDIALYSRSKTKWWLTKRLPYLFSRPFLILGSSAFISCLITIVSYSILGLGYSPSEIYLTAKFFLSLAIGIMVLRKLGNIHNEMKKMNADSNKEKLQS